MISLLVTGLLASAALSAAKTLDMENGLMVHLFEWRYEDIANECEYFLDPMGFTAVLISPPNENLVIPGRPWYERNQPVSYELISRSGNKEDLIKMVKHCNDFGISVIVDVVLNNMAADADVCVGTGGNVCNSKEFEFLKVPFKKEHFYYPPVKATNYNEPDNVRKGEVLGLHKLNQHEEYVRIEQAKYLNTLIEIGVAGFRFSAAKHMYPAHLADIYGRLNNLNIGHGFPPDTKPFVFSDVMDLGTEAIKFSEYTDLGMVTDYKYGNELGMKLKNGILRDLETFGDNKWDMVPDDKAVVFTDTHASQHSDDTFLPFHIDFRQSNLHKVAVAFMLAWGHGMPILMSSYEFTDHTQGPPSDDKEKTLSPDPKKNICTNGWKCEHRWRQIYNMVHFYNVVKGSKRDKWWTNGNNQIAFCRVNKGFIAINLENYDLKDVEFETCMPEGEYCEIFSGNVGDGVCEEGKTIIVNSNGKATITVPARSETEDGVVAIHLQAIKSFKGERLNPERLNRYKPPPKVDEHPAPKVEEHKSKGSVEIPITKSTEVTTVTKGMKSRIASWRDKIFRL